ncbi:MAG TPA: TonB family protein [Acidobacteriaceae bacterium]|nr:TonB family protein [Acidobacteriaceae bacterium]
MESTQHLHADEMRDFDRLGGGALGAVGLHVLVAAAVIGAAFLSTGRHERWGEKAASVGAIQASMVSALPLPSHAKPVEKQVLASEDVNEAPLPPPKAAAEPPPKPTDILIKSKTPEKPPPPAPTHSTAPAKPDVQAQPTEAPAVKHPQPTPDSPKARTGETTATQLPEAVSQAKNGTATATVEDRTFGVRYAYYLRGVSQRVSQNWFSGEVDPRSSQGKRVTLLFDIDRDGTPQNVRLETRSGSSTLDQSALRAVQRVDGFGPLPAGDKITIEFAFDYKQP